MSNKSKFLNQSERHNYLIDKIFINHYSKVSINQDNLHVLRKKQSIKVPGLKRWLKVEPLNHFTALVRFQTSHNLNSIAREYIKSEYALKGVYTKSFSGVNFIPFSYRVFLKRKGISVTTIRHIVTRLFFEEINEFYENVSDHLKEKYFCTLNLDSFSKSINEIEVNYDLLMQKGNELASNKKVIASIGKHTREFTRGRFINKAGNRTIVSSIKDSSESHGEGGIGIKGYCFDNSRYSIYTKEVSKLGNLERIERTFGKEQIPHYSSCTFDSKEDFNKIIKSLSRATYNTFIKPLNRPISFSSKENMKIIKSYCIEFFGRNYWLAYKALTRGKQAILTGKNGNTNNSVARVAKRLSNNKVFIRKKKNVRGYYVLDKRWIRFNYKK